MAHATIGAHVSFLTGHVGNNPLLVQLNACETLKINRDALLRKVKSQVTVLERGSSIYSDLSTNKL